MALNFDIDYVFPYVNGADPEWAAQHARIAAAYGRKEDGSAVRYNDFGMLKYMVRGLAQNMPWLRKVHIIVERHSQVPDWMNTDKIHVVYHDEIMPKFVLPTYNSSTIEMFLHNIPGLADHFIYGNDDMYTLRPLQPEDFFTEDGKPKVSFDTFTNVNATNMFRKMCFLEWKEVHAILGKTPNRDNHLRPKHDLAPLYLPHVRQIRQALNDSIVKHLEPFRNAYQHQQYLYIYYSYLLNFTEPSERKFYYTNNQRDPVEVVSQIGLRGAQAVCVNDEDSAWRQKWLQHNAFQDYLQQLYPNPCKYEKDG